MESFKSALGRYDVLSIVLHWSIAIFIVGLFTSGLWMVTLGYYDDWYYRAPWWHMGFGVITAVLVIARLIWTLCRTPIKRIRTIPVWQYLAAKCVHELMNMATIVIVISGYLMVTIKGDGLNVFDWFTIPALFTAESTWSDTAGLIHLWTAYVLIGLASCHALAALKHHFIDKDHTLKRMIGISKENDL